ncbi:MULTISPECIES: helix-turn-helix transcriptional regulator [Flammeovirga]|uniref:WYL domain-containing protein n=1 Tax=Flammeovirga agarivorans TaxID=2726742 RepID=A0A7X8SI09_9BACT|nr:MULTISPECIES: WYL domain-containing protein [Flammeovirga]NLR90580.1 WYL domain-containing protein [Flammeovirga agarivorans]
MKSSKLSFLRYLLIDKCIRNKQKPYPSKMELLERCSEEFGVNSPSTIEKDLQALRYEFDAPIAYSKREDGYYYKNPDYKLLGVSLTSEHMDALNFVETFLVEFKDLPVFGNFSNAVDKVLDGLEITKKFKNDTKENFESFIQLEKSIYSKGSKVFSALINAAKNHQVIDIEYQKFDSLTVDKYTFHPYLIKEYKGLWYITGYADNRQGIRTLAIDRIASVEENKNAVFLHSHQVDFDRDIYFKHCIGVTIKGVPQNIRLRFSNIAANYIKTTPIHDSQKIIYEDESSIEISLKLIDNPELRAIILGWGNQVEVLSPFSLRKKIGEEIKKLALVY